MFLLTVVFGENDTLWQACFDNEKSMLDAAFEAGILKQCFTDDYGTEIFLPKRATAFQVRDTSKAQLAEIEMMLHNARTQNKAQRAAATDPTLSVPQLAVPTGGMNFRQ